MTLVLGLCYFLAGVFACFGGLLVWSRGSAPPPPKVPRKWSSISRLAWEFKFDFDFTEAMSGTDIAIAMTETMRRKVERDGLPDFEVRPGNYSVHFDISANFVKRD